MKHLFTSLFALLASAAFAAPNDIIITQNNATTGTAQIQTIIPGTPNTLIGVSASGKVANYTADATGDIVLTADEIGLANNLSIGSTASSSSITLYGLGANNLGPAFYINDQSGQIAAIGSSNSIAGGTARQLAFYSPNGIYIDSNTTVNATIQAPIYSTSASSSGPIGSLFYNSANGLTLYAKTGSNYDFSILDYNGGNYAMVVPTGTYEAEFPGNIIGLANINIAGTSTLTGNVTTNGNTFTQRSAGSDYFNIDSTSTGAVTHYLSSLYSTGTQYAPLTIYTGNPCIIAPGTITQITVTPTNVTIAGTSTLTGNVTVGTNGSGVNNSITIQGEGAVGGVGPYLFLRDQSAAVGYLTDSNYVSGGTSRIFSVWGSQGFNIYTSGGILAASFDNSQNATFAKQINITNAASKGPTNQNLTPAPTVLTEAGNATTIDWSTSNTFTLTLNGNLNTVTFSNALSGQTIVVAITNNATAYTVTFGNSIKWTGGSQPVQTINKTDVWTIIDLGGTLYGSVVQNF